VVRPSIATSQIAGSGDKQSKAKIAMAMAIAAAGLLGIPASTANAQYVISSLWTG
jgi:hypothetical protein